MAIVGKINQIDVNDSQFVIDQSYLNLNDFLQNPNAYASKQSARGYVPTYFRTNGRAITYKLAQDNDYIWVSEQFIGSSWSTADADWQDLGPVKVTQNTETGKTELKIGGNVALTVDKELEAGSHNLIENGAVADEAFYLGNLHRGYINNGVWTDLTSGNRYYAIIKLDGFDGKNVYAKAPISAGSSIAFLSNYNPIEGGTANVLKQKDISDDSVYSVAVPVGTKYIYVLSKTGSPATDRKPIEFTIDGIDILATTKENVLLLKKYSATKVELQNTDSEIAALDEKVYGQVLDSTTVIESGISPVSTVLLNTTDITSYNLKSGDKIKIHLGFGGAISSWRLYINGTNKGTVTSEDYTYTFAENGESIKLNVQAGGIVVDEETSKTVGGTVTIHIEVKQGDIPYLQEEIDDIKEGISNSIVSRNADIKDIVHAGKIINNPSDKSQIQLFDLLISGDIHGYGTQMNSLIEYFNTISDIDAGIMLGDLVGSSYTSDFSFYVPALQKILNNKPFITIAGNHDMGTSTNPALDAPSMQDFYERYYEPTLPYAQLASGEHSDSNCYFYKDFSTYKIRMIMLNEFDYPDEDLTDLVEGELRYQRGLSMYSQSQIDWLISTLNSTPSDYAVIIALHMCPWRMYGEESSFTPKYFEGTFGRSSSVMSGDVIGDIVNAWKNGATLSETYTIEVPSVRTSVTATADFTNRGTGEFVCYIGGHWHNYIISHDYAHPDQKMITVNNAGCVARESDMPRLVGTKSEDAFAILSVDRVNKCINIVTVGARMSNRLVERQTLRIEYESSN